MQTTWRALFWKEWHEHKWKLASIMLILLGATTLPIFLSERDKLGLAYGMLLMCMIPLAVFIGLGTAASERSRGTLQFLQALPVPMRRAALVKFAMGLATVIVPIVTTVMAIWMWRTILIWGGAIDRDPQRDLGGIHGPIDTGYLYLDLALFCAIIAASLYVWAAACGVNRKDEVSAGAVALAVLVGWATILAVVIRSFVDETNIQLGRWVVAFTFSLAPGGVAMLVSQGDFSKEQIALCVWISVLLHLLLAVFYVRRFGRISAREITSPHIALAHSAQRDWLSPPYRSTLFAIAWKQFRESGPVALVGLTGIVGIALLMFSLQRSDSRLITTYVAVAATLGSAIAMVIGIGIILNDLGPKLNTFWRSRPINPDSWFCVKFVTGLAVVLLSVYLPLALVAIWTRDSIADPDAVLIVPALHVSLFAAAVAMTCLVRHAVYAAILSIAALIIAVLTVWLAWIGLGRLGWYELPPELPVPLENLNIVFSGFIVSFVISTFVAWLAVRYDWGRKSRY